MLNFFKNLTFLYQPFLAGTFTFLVTTLGASIVFFFKDINKKCMDSMLSISAGIMLSASYFSLLKPAINASVELSISPLIVIFGFLLGGYLLFICDKILDNVSLKKVSSLKRSIILFSSITIHNIPEGLVLGIAFGAIKYNINSASFLSAITLTLGIALQNFPEGSAISLPLRREGISKFKSFLFGSLSAIVEPIFAILGALLVLKIQIFLPFIMALAAGAMIFVIVMELIPESQTNKEKGLMALYLLLGFTIMMILEIMLT